MNLSCVVLRCTPGARLAWYVLALAALLHAGATAQEPSGRLDAVVYMKTVRIGIEYTKGGLVEPPSATISFVDQVRINEENIAFTVKVADKNPEGWAVYLDFDADMYGRKRLVRMHAQKKADKNADAEFEKLVKWIPGVMSEVIKDQKAEGNNRVSWTYVPRTQYSLVAKTVTIKKPKQTWLTITLNTKPGGIDPAMGP